MRRYFAFFLVSGFCGLVYETVWIRLSMGQFGVTPASLSVVVSLFMAGLALGSWLVARAKRRLEGLDARASLRAYAFAELSIGLLGLLVPVGIRFGGALCTSLLAGKGPLAWYAAAFLWQGVLLLPATAAMGATIPLAMQAISKAHLPGGGTSFSYLYLANVLGAILGALIPTFILIEVLGFRDTLLIAFVLNLGIAVSAWYAPVVTEAPQSPAAQESLGKASTAESPVLLVLLFLSGLCSLGMEVVWTRQFTVLVGTFVYSFASILAIYLAATFLGSAMYRRLKGRSSPLGVVPWAVVSVCSALPLLATDLSLLGRLPLFGAHMRVSLESLARVALGVGPLSAALGFLTPQLVDCWSHGRSDKAGLAYAVNTVGCILGPLLAGFLLLPWLSSRWALAILLLPFSVAACLFALKNVRKLRALATAGVAVTATVALLLGTRSFEEQFPAAQVQRDHTATTIAYGEGMEKRLLVNGVGMTVLTPATKMMAHFPLASLEHPPKSALTICFGMGTTFRSLLTWGIEATAVELVPGVPKLFPYFHDDASTTLSKASAHIVIDDGRRFLETDSRLYDVIIIDPPPPVQAASSSLLYSVELYSLLKRRLAPGGILQQWIPGGEDLTLASMVKALHESFPHVRLFLGQLGGMHILASMSPLPQVTAETLASKLPAAAAKDFVEWGPRDTVAEQFADVLGAEISVEQVLARFPEVPALSDNRPINEYFFLRTMF